MSTFIQRMRGAVAFVGVGVRATPNERDTATPQITSGEGVPSAALPDGSVYLRTDNSNPRDCLYIMIAASWYPMDGA